MGALANPARGVWVTTELGKSLAEPEVEPLRKTYLMRLAEARKKKKKAAQEAGADLELTGEGLDAETDDWHEELLQVLLKMDPTGFEHLAKRLLRAAGARDTRAQSDPRRSVTFVGRCKGVVTRAFS